MVNTAAPEIPPALAGTSPASSASAASPRSTPCCAGPGAAPGAGPGPPPVGGAPGATTAPPGPAVAPRPVQRRGRRGRREGLHVDAVGRRLRPEPAVRPRPDGHRADHRHRRVRAVLQRRHRHLRGCYGLSNPVRVGRGRRHAERPGFGLRRGRARHRDGRRQRPLRLHSRVRGAERDRATGPRSICTTASPPTTWPKSSPPVGACASRTTPRLGRLRRRTSSSSAWPPQGQTMVAASGDSGSEDCYGA